MGRSSVSLPKILGVLAFLAGVSACVDRNGGGSNQDVEGDYQTCIPQCEAKECGDDGCGGTCGTCPAAAPICTDIGLCVATCAPACDGKECGPDGCGNQCGNCPQAAPYCDAQGMCQATCNPNCSGRECGDDGCGGSCGSCPAVAPICASMGTCQLQCNADCTGRVCGDDGCGGSCGTCTEPTPFCTEAGACVGSCSADCTGKQCGPDGCGGVCGECPQGEVCGGTQCVPELCQGLDCGASGTCDTPYGYPLCQCDPGYYDIGSGCQSGLSTHVITGDIALDCTGEFAGVFGAIGSKTVRVTMLCNLGQAQEATCDNGPPMFDSVKCTEISGTVIALALDGVDIQTNNLFDTLIGAPFVLKFLVDSNAVDSNIVGMRLINIVPVPQPTTAFTGFQFGSQAAIPLAVSNGYPQVVLPLQMQAGVTLYYYPPGFIDVQNCSGNGTITVK